MKKQSFFSFLFLLLTSALTFGQVLDQGNFIIGSTLGCSAANSKIVHSTNDTEADESGPLALQINFSPKAGYFIIDNIALGLGLDYSHSSIKNPNEDRTNNSDLLFGPYVRTYLPLGMKKDMALFVELNFGFGSSSDDQFIGQNKQHINSNIFAVGIGPGFTIFSNSSIGIEALFKYNFARSQFKTEDGFIKTTTTTTANQFDISIGVQFYFDAIGAGG